MIKTKSAGGVVMGPHHDVIIVSQFGLTWSLPKGHLEENESDLEAAYREIFEETGIKDLNLIASLGSYERFKIGKNGTDDSSELKHITLFLFSTSQTRLQSHDSDNPDVRWVKLDEVSSYLSHLQDKAFFERSIQTIKKEMCL